VPAKKKPIKKPVRRAAAKKQAAVAEAPATYAPPKQQVSISAAKGRPMLTWVGKRPLRQISVFPAQQVEVFDPTGEAGKREGGLLFHGDNKEVLAHLLANGYRGKVNLVYIDPPFDSGADYVRKVQLRGVGGAAKLDGESYTLGEQIQYTDIWANDNYLQFMYERLLLLKELLSEDGSIYVHCDPRRSPHLRCLLDEVFGADHFRSEVIWKRADAHSSADRYGPIHDNILYYTTSFSPIWNVIRTGVKQDTADTWYTNEEILERDIVNQLGIQLRKEFVRRYNKADISAPGSREGTRAHFQWKGHYPPSGRHWSITIEDMQRLDDEGRLIYSGSGKVYEKRYLDETTGAPLQSLWTDIQQLRGMQLTDKVDTYPTEKPEELLDRIVKASSSPGDLVLDCFVGSGTTPAVAQKLGRRWIACDINKGAIQTTSKRLQTIIAEQLQQEAERKAKPRLMEAKAKDETPRPAQLSFAVYRVNDYDLQIQHNEAVNLACERIGVTRTKGDGFFDGTLGKKLVKIIPFNHPLSPLDLEEVKRELSARPDEERDITVVSLGKEFATDAWLEEWNRLRRKGDVPNKIEVIELRTDPKYGQFFVHQPASARVSVKRADGELHIEIKDFISPSIVERLKQQTGVLTPQITDWRAMVDTIMIDTAYDGRVFNIAHSDVPEKKSDLVEGKYTLPAPMGKTTVAIKIVDMLGDEVMMVYPI